MTYEERRETVYTEIYDYLKDHDYVARDIHNEIDNGNFIFLMEDFNDEYDHEAPSTIAKEVSNGSYDSDDEYFIRDCGECRTFSDLEDEVDYDDLTDNIIDYENDYGYDGLKELLDRLNEEDHNGIKVDNSEYTYEEFKNSYENTDILMIDAGECGLYENIDIRTAREWAESLDENSEITLETVNFADMLEGKSHTNIAPIVGYTGYIFGNNEEFYEGRFFRYFYVPEKNLLLRLIYGSMPNNSWDGEFADPMYIKDTRATLGGIYSVVKQYC